MKTGRKDYSNKDGQAPMGSVKPEPLFGEELFQSVTNRCMLERDQHTTEDSIIRGKLLKGSVSTHFTAYPTGHF